MNLVNRKRKNTGINKCVLKWNGSVAGDCSVEKLE